jgi:sortase A
MGRTALVLVAALVMGASAGFFVHDGRARAPQPSASVAPAVTPRPLPQRIAPRRRVQAVERPRKIEPARISIPRLQLESRVFASANVDRGPAWWRVTGRPGGGDTIAVAGHRTTHSRPFYYLERLRPGDAIYVRYQGETHRYRVVNSWVRAASDLHIADAVGYERLLLTACTPRGSARYRLVVEARRAS